MKNNNHIKANVGQRQEGKPINAPAIPGSYYEAEVPDTLDLAERARLGLNHFLDIMREEYHYDVYFDTFEKGPWQSPAKIALVGNGDVLRPRFGAGPCSRATKKPWASRSRWAAKTR